MAPNFKYTDPMTYLNRLEGRLVEKFEDDPWPVLTVFACCLIPSYVGICLKFCVHSERGFPILQKMYLVWIACSLVPRLLPIFQLHHPDRFPVITAEVEGHPGKTLAMTYTDLCIFEHKEVMCRPHFGAGFLSVGTTMMFLATICMAIMIYIRDACPDPNLPGWVFFTQRNHCCKTSTKGLRETWTAIPQVMGSFMYATSFTCYMCLVVYMNEAYGFFPNGKTWNSKSMLPLAAYVVCSMFSSLWALVAFSLTGSKYDPNRRAIV